MAKRWRWNPVEMVTGEGLCVFITEQDTAWQRPLRYFCASYKQMVMYCLRVTTVESMYSVSVSAGVGSNNALYITERILSLSLPPLPYLFPLSPLPLSPSPVVPYISLNRLMVQKLQESEVSFSPPFFGRVTRGATVFKSSWRRGKEIKKDYSVTTAALKGIKGKKRQSLTFICVKPPWTVVGEGSNVKLVLTPAW